VKQQKDGIFISQDKYVAKILRKFRLTEGKSASTPIDTKKPLLKDPDGKDVDVHTYRLMIGSLMYLTSLRPDIMCAVNDVTRLQALVDKKKLVVTEAAIREILRLDDAEGVDFLPNEEIFIELARMGYEKPSTKLTFYKHSSRASGNSTTQFYMYPYFLQLIIRKQVGNLSTHTTKYALPTLTQKIFANMRRVKKGFSVVETPLFEGMLVDQEIEEEGDADEHVKDVTTGDAGHGDDSAAHGKFLLLLNNHPYHLLHHLFHHHKNLKISLQHLRRVEHLEYDKVAQALEITKLKRRVKKLEKRNKARVLKLRRLQKVGTSQRVDTPDDTVMDDEANRGRMIDEMDKDDAIVLMDDKKVEEAKVDESAQEDESEPAEVEEVVDVVTTAKLITEVVTAASATIPTTEPQVPAATLTNAPARVAVAPSRRRKGVVIRDPEEESTTSKIIHAETKSKDKGKGILVKEPKPLKKKQHIKMDVEYARKLHVELNKDIDWDVATDHVKLKAKEDPANVASFKLDYFKRMSYDDIRLIFEAKFNSNVDFLLKTKEQMEEEENRALQTINETPTEKAAKRRKLNEEVEDLKRHLEIVPDEDDDVYTKATPLARKVHVLDYEIIELNNKPYYKIIRADGTHQLYISFLTLLRNFDKEDLEALWSLVKERFSTSKPKNFSDDFLLTTLGAMFEKPDAHA
nr:hypothetical protein [Tanacetum cinerariifolium]